MARLLPECQELAPTVLRMMELWQAEVTLLHVMDEKHRNGRKSSVIRMMDQMRTMTA